MGVFMLFVFLKAAIKLRALFLQGDTLQKVNAVAVEGIVNRA